MDRTDMNIFEQFAPEYFEYIAKCQLLTFPLPYLETEQGRNCKLRKLFPAELYFSKLWSTTPGAVVERPDCVESDTVKSNAEPSNKENEQQLLPAHDFVKMKITSAATSRDIQTKLAEFRSFGGRFPKGRFLSEYGQVY